MKRREFLQYLGMGLAGGWAFGRHFWPRAALAGIPEVRLAFLADAHLKDGGESRPEARALARAVAELGALTPAPQLILFAGDLAHNGNPAALALGHEILAELPAPLLPVMGEGDGLPDGAAAWRRLFGDPWFSRNLPGLQVLGLHTAWCPGPGGPGFRVGDSGRRWLARELDRLDPEVPLIILSHAPLDPIYRPWQQWTVDGPEVLRLLAGFRQVLCLHGHTHHAGGCGQGSGAGSAVAQDFYAMGPGLFTANREQNQENRLHLSLPATAWSGPQAVMGTPAQLGPGLGTGGCGWLLLAAASAALRFQPQIWQA